MPFDFHPFGINLLLTASSSHIIAELNENNIQHATVKNGIFFINDHTFSIGNQIGTGSYGAVFTSIMDSNKVCVLKKFTIPIRYIKQQRQSVFINGVIREAIIHILIAYFAN